MRFVLIFLGLFPIAAMAQQRDSVFASYAAYETFVDHAVMSRDFIGLINTLGGRDEYTPQELQGIQRQFHSIYPQDFSAKAVTKEIDLGAGFQQEMRVYWNGTGYVYYYALLHQRPDGLIVLKFNINSNIDKVLAQF